jgi:hypothetical protein
MDQAARRLRKGRTDCFAARVVAKRERGRVSENGREFAQLTSVEGKRDKHSKPASKHKQLRPLGNVVAQSRPKKIAERKITSR